MERGLGESGGSLMRQRSWPPFPRWDHDAILEILPLVLPLPSDFSLLPLPRLLLASFLCVAEVRQPSVVA